MNQIYTSTHYVLHNYKVYDILLGSFRGVALTRKTGLPDWLTDWWTGQKHYTLRNSLRGVKYWPLINCLGDCFNQCIHEEWKTGSSWTSSHQGRGFSADHNADCLKVKPERTYTFTLCILWYFRNILLYFLFGNTFHFIYIHRRCTILLLKLWYHIWSHFSYCLECYCMYFVNTLLSW